LNQRNSDWLTIYTDIQIFTIDKNFNHNIKKLWKLPVEIFALKRSKVGVKGFEKRSLKLSQRAI